MNRYLYSIILLCILFCTCSLPVDEVTSPPEEWPVTIKFIGNEPSLKQYFHFYDSIKVEITGNGFFQKVLHCTSAYPFITTTLPAGQGRIFKAIRSVSSSYQSYVSDTATIIADTYEDFNTVTINLIPVTPPCIIKNPENCSATYHTYAQFAIEAQGYDLTYTWEKNGVTVSESKSPFFNLYVNKPDSGSVITCSVCNASGCVESTPAILSVRCDTVPPELYLIDKTVELPVNDTFIDSKIYAFDLLDKNLSNNIIRTGEVNTTIPGEYKLHYSVADFCGNTAAATRTVKVRSSYTEADSTRPVIVLEGPDTIWQYYFDVVDRYKDSAFQAYDRDNQDITADVIVSEVNLFFLDLHYLEYDVRDKNGVSAITRRRFFRYKRLIPITMENP